LECDLWLYEEQRARWHTPAPRKAAPQEIARLHPQLAELRRVLTPALALADAMHDTASEHRLATDDCALGLACLMGNHQRDEPGVEAG
jgi:hypothetical protein